MKTSELVEYMQERTRKMKILTKNMEKDLNRDLSKYLKENPRKLLFYQNQQLFKKSIDANGEPLGFYSWTTDVVSKGKKKQNTPFTMVDSGGLKKGMYVEVKYNKFSFSSHTSDLDKILGNEVFDGLQLFGLTDDSLRRFNNNVIKPFVKEWMNQQVQELLET